MYFTEFSENLHKNIYLCMLSSTTVTRSYIHKFTKVIFENFHNMTNVNVMNVFLHLENKLWTRKILYEKSWSHNT